MKRTIPLLLAAFLLSTLLSVPVQAAEAADAAKPVRDSAYYPISVEEYTAGDFDELRIQKVYQLSLDDDPSLISTEDFERNGRLYYLLDMTRKDEVGVDTKPHVQTVTLPSDTNNVEKILQTLDAEIEATTEDGYTGTLHLDHTTVKVTTDGYATKTGTVSATRTYPNLSDADLSLVPLAKVANVEKKFPLEWIADGNQIADAFFDYAMPLMGECFREYALLR